MSSYFLGRFPIGGKRQNRGLLGFVIPAEALHHMVYRAEAGIQPFFGFWISVFTGMTATNDLSHIAKAFLIFRFLNFKTSKLLNF